MAPYLIFLAGLVVLTFAGDALVRGAVTIARHFHVPSLIIGLTIISMGTSAPELFVSLQAALEGAPGLSVGNAVGSNIANTLIVMGLPALVAPLYFTSPGVRRSTTFMIIVSVGLFVLANDGMISTFDGLILVSIMVLYLAYSLSAASKARKNKLNSKNGEATIPENGSMLRAVGYLGFGFLGLAVGARLIVESAMELATIWGVGETVVGTTIVALGTTLPEIAATLAAAFRREAGVAIGNIIGSNIFNIVGILGITAIIVPLPVTAHLLEFDIWVLLASSALLIPLAFMRRPIGKIIGGLLTFSYVAYLYLSLAG